MDAVLPFAESLERLKESFLWAAAKGGHEEDCLSLLEYGADVNWRSPEGDTALIAACRAGHSHIVTLLLSQGADVDLQTPDGSTALHAAVQRGDQNLTKLLLEASCSPTIANVRGETAQAIATAKGFTHLANVIQQYAPRNSAASLTQQSADSAATVRSLQIRHRHRLPSIPSSSSPSPSSSLAGTVHSQQQHSREEQLVVDTVRTLSHTSGIDAHATANIDIGSKPGQRQKPAEAYSQVRSARAGRQVDTEHLQEQNQLLQQENAKLRLRIEHYQGSNLQNLTVPQLEQLEYEMRHAIEAVTKRKDALMQEAIIQQREQRLCVVCQENEKSVVFLPCRHMCVCADCADHHKVKTCPLCRHAIETRFSVYA